MYFDCTYCYLEKIKQQEKAMSVRVGRKIIDSVSELKQQNKQIVFHGSEPFLNFPLMINLVDYSKIRDYNIEFSLQTNGSIIDEDKLKLLSERDIGIGVSLDGLRYHQDKNRKYIGGLSSYVNVTDNLAKLKRFQNGVSVITVVTKENVGDLERIVTDFENKGINSVLFSLVGSKDSSIYPDTEILFEKMELVLERYINMSIQGERTIKIRNLRDLLRTFFKEKTTSNCVQCGGTQSHPLIAVDIDGSIYPCDFFWGNKEYKIGNIFNDTLEECFNSEKNFRVYRDINEIKECSVCDWKRFCGGGCSGISVLEERGITSRSYYCDYFKKIYTYIAKTIPTIHENKLMKKFLN